MRLFFYTLWLLLTPPLWAQINLKQHIAVLEFSGDQKDFNPTDLKTLTERFETELIKTDVYSVLERRQMNLIMQEQGFQNSGACDQSSCQVEIGKILGVEKMIFGSISKVGDLYSMNLKKVDVETGKLEFSHALDIKGDFEDLITGGCYEMAQIFSGNKIPDSKHTILEASSNNLWIWLTAGAIGTAAIVTTIVLMQPEDAKDRTVANPSFSLEAP